MARISAGGGGGGISRDDSSGGDDARAGRDDDEEEDEDNVDLNLEELGFSSDEDDVNDEGYDSPDYDDDDDDEADSPSSSGGGVDPERLREAAGDDNSLAGGTDASAGRAGGGADAPNITDTDADDGDSGGGPTLPFDPTGGDGDPPSLPDVDTSDVPGIGDVDASDVPGVDGPLLGDSNTPDIDVDLDRPDVSVDDANLPDTGLPSVGEPFTVDTDTPDTDAPSFPGVDAEGVDAPSAPDPDVPDVPDADVDARVRRAADALASTGERAVSTGYDAAETGVETGRGVVDAGTDAAGVVGEVAQTGAGLPGGGAAGAVAGGLGLASEAADAAGPAVDAAGSGVDTATNAIGGGADAATDALGARIGGAVPDRSFDPGIPGGVTVDTGAQAQGGDNDVQPTGLLSFLGAGQDVLDVNTGQSPLPGAQQPPTPDEQPPTPGDQPVLTPDASNLTRGTRAIEDLTAGGDAPPGSEQTGGQEPGGPNDTFYGLRARTPDGRAIPTRPGNPAVQVVDADSGTVRVQVTQGNVGPDTYEVFDSRGNKLGEVEQGSGTISGLEPGRQYAIRIRSKDGATKSGREWTPSRLSEPQTFEVPGGEQQQASGGGFEFPFDFRQPPFPSGTPPQPGQRPPGGQPPGGGFPGRGQPPTGGGQPGSGFPGPGQPPGGQPPGTQPGSGQPVPSFAITNIDKPASVPVGEDYTVEFTVQNRGAAPGSFTLNWNFGERNATLRPAGTTTVAVTQDRQSESDTTEYYGITNDATGQTTDFQVDIGGGTAGLGIQNVQYPEAAAVGRQVNGSITLANTGSSAGDYRVTAEDREYTGTLGAGETTTIQDSFTKTGVGSRSFAVTAFDAADGTRADRVAVDVATQTPAFTIENIDFPDTIAPSSQVDGAVTVRNDSDVGAPVVVALQGGGETIERELYVPAGRSNRAAFGFAKSAIGSDQYNVTVTDPETGQTYDRGFVRVGSAEPEFTMQSIEAPAEVREGQNYEVTVDVANDGTGRGTAIVNAAGNEKSVTLTANGGQPVTFNFRKGQTPVETITVELRNATTGTVDSFRSVAVRLATPASGGGAAPPEPPLSPIGSDGLPGARANR